MVDRERSEGAKVITLSLVHCCLLSDLIWSHRHTWAKAHPSQVLQDPAIARSVLPSIHPSIPIFLCPPLPFLAFLSRLSKSLTTYLSRSVLNILSPSHSFWFFSVLSIPLCHKPLLRQNSHSSCSVYNNIWCNKRWWSWCSKIGWFYHHVQDIEHGAIAIETSIHINIQTSAIMLLYGLRFKAVLRCKWKTLKWAKQ